MHVTTLVDNSPGLGDLVFEHGLSLGISLPRTEVLFDTGLSTAFARNARTLGYDLSRVDLAILSHGHYDHGGGLGAFFETNSNARLYLKKGAGGDFFAERDRQSHYIGLDKGMMEKNVDRLRWVSGPMSIGPNVHLVTAFPDLYGRPSGNSALKEKCGDLLIQDKFDHELALIIKEEDGITIFTGCGHSGVLNMVSAAKSRFPRESIKAIIGGFHLKSDPSTGIPPSSTEVGEIGRELVHLGCARIYGGHCTGPEASEILKRELGNTYRELRTGMRFSI